MDSRESLGVSHLLLARVTTTARIRQVRDITSNLVVGLTRKSSTMSEAELIESANLAYSNGIACYAIFWTLAGSYLVVAYQVGQKLTRSQLVIINALFLVSIGLTSFGIWAYFNAGIEFSQEVAQLNPTRPGRYAPNALPVIQSVTNLLVVLACFKFTWDIRHPKGE